MREPLAARFERSAAAILQYGFPLLCVLCVSSCAQFGHRGTSRPYTLGPEYYTSPAGPIADEAPPRAAALHLDLNAPRSAGVGQEVRFTLDVSNTGEQQATGVVVRLSVPPGVRYVDATPPARPESDVQRGEIVEWEVGSLGGGQQRHFSARFEAQGRGRLLSRAEATSAESLRADATAATEVSEAQLRVEMQGPQQAVVGQSVTFDIIVINGGNVAATNLVLTDTLGDGLVYDFVLPSGVTQERTGAVSMGLKRLEPGQRQSYPLTVRGKKAGLLRNQVSVVAEGGLEAHAETSVQFQQQSLAVTVVGPHWRSRGGRAEFNITVTNTGEAPLRGVGITDYIPDQMSFFGASQGGMNWDKTVQWNLGGDLEPGQTTRVSVELNADVVVPKTINRVTVTSQGGVQAQAEAALEIRAKPPGLDTYMYDLEDMIKVGEQVTYEIGVQNNGDMTARGLQIDVQAPPELELIPDPLTKPPDVRVEEQTQRHWIFGPADLGAGMKWEFHVRARAVAPHPDARFRVRFQGGGLQEGLTEEEPTTIIPGDATP